MAGARIDIELNNLSASRSLTTALEALENPQPLLANIREHLTRIHRQRFSDQRAPDGTPWAPLSPRYRKRKKQNADKTLVLRGYLMNTLRGVIGDDGLAFGTDRPYGAAHQFGAEIGAHKTKIPARPWLGTSDEDENYLVGMARDYLARAVSGR